MTVAPRATRKRTEIRDALARAHGFVTAQDLHAAMQREGNAVGLATVYRALAAMADSGEIDTVQGGSGETAYRACASSMHHHHLTCRSCGRTVELELDEVERMCERLADVHGFRQLAHVVEINGICPDCA